MIVSTLLFLRKTDQILLAMKKRGVGEGKWNGIGGKVVAGETIEAATVRECQEEIGVTPTDLVKVAELEFFIPHLDYHTLVHTFSTASWEGEPTETEEMAPQWSKIDAIPYNRMWSDDRLWLPKVLAGEKIKGYFEFDEHERVTKSSIEEL